MTGYVPDDRTVIRKAAVLVIPMRLGAGVKLKLLTAFASGRAVVSTTAGAEGVADLTDGKELLIRETAQDFADATVDVIENAQLRHNLERNGRALACRDYDWKIIGKQWEAALESVSARKTVSVSR